METLQRIRMEEEQAEFDEFIERLNLAVEQHPDYRAARGKFTWFRDHLEAETGLSLTAEAVRKWLTGRVRAPLQHVSAVAKALRVDPAWLAFGRRSADHLSDLGAALVATALKAVGAAVAPVEEARSGVSLHVISNGRSRFVYATLAEPTEGGCWTMKPPTKPGATDWVIVLPESPLTYRFVHVDPTQDRRLASEDAKKSLLLAPTEKGGIALEGRLCMRFDPATF